MFRKYNVGHSAPLEFGATEAGTRNEGEFGTKAMNEGFCKLSIVLKDLLDCLLEQVGNDKRSTSLHTVDFCILGWLAP